jgi:hypothetical protein
LRQDPASEDRRRDSLVLFALCCAVVVFVLLPAFCLYADDWHPQRDPSCPYCNLILTYVAILGFVAVVFHIVCESVGFTRPPRLRRRTISRHVGLPFVRGPPVPPHHPRLA